MRYSLRSVVLSGFLGLAACSPTFNWRDVRPVQTPLTALFPCKPDRETRVVSLGSKDVALTMLACVAGGVTFTLAYADMKDAARTGAVLAQWKQATLANLRAQASRELPFLPQGARVLPQSVQVQADGVRQDGARVVLQAVWFTAGSLAYQAAVYADAANPAVAETYFAGLRLP